MRPDAQGEPRLTDNFSKYYTESSFWTKSKKYARQMGRSTLHKALILYYVGVDPKTPVWAKGVVAAALGYLILPLDAVPDLTPFAGFADDAGAIAAALAAIAMRISKAHRNLADQKLHEWFGEDPKEPTSESGPHFSSRSSPSDGV